MNPDKEPYATIASVVVLVVVALAVLGVFWLYEEVSRKFLESMTATRQQNVSIILKKFDRSATLPAGSINNQKEFL